MEKIKKVTFTSIGENRCPKKGESYFNDGMFYKASFDYDVSSYDIYTREEFEEQWKPKINELYYHLQDLSSIPSVYLCYFKDDNIDVSRINCGNCFKTLESAEAKLKEIKEILLN